MLGLAGDVSVDVPIPLEAASEPVVSQTFQGAEDGGPADVGLGALQPSIELICGQLAVRAAELGRDQQALAGDALASILQPVGDGNCPGHDLNGSISETEYH